MQKEKPETIGFKPFHGGADDRGRTGTGITSHGILSPGRLPIPPHRHLFTTVELYHSERVKSSIFDFTLQSFITFLSTYMVKTAQVSDISPVFLPALLLRTLSWTARKNLQNVQRDL